jgi:ATP-dependent 26S proteasome regulatory subunit
LAGSEGTTLRVMKEWRVWILGGVLGMAAIVGLWRIWPASAPPTVMNLTELGVAVEAKRIQTAVFVDRGVRGKLLGKGSYAASLDNPELEADLARSMLKRGVSVTFERSERGGWDTALNCGVALALAAVAFLMFRFIASQGQRATMASMKPLERINPKDIETTFSSVAGYENAKSELQELVLAVQAPETFSHLGGEPPRSVLLVGPPGTGKTMLARALAKAAAAGFHAGSGSEFVELFVGVGAARMRSLFAHALEEAPAIIFIDEVDAVARVRGNSPSGSSMEHDNTLNELLVQLDGFFKERRRGVIFIGATNREDVLDPAFVQRMNRRIHVGVPTSDERIKILRKHMPESLFDLGPADFLELAVQTAGMSGRELENLAKQTGRERHQRLLVEAQKHCLATLPATDECWLRMPNSKTRDTASPVVFAGCCWAGATVSIRFEALKKRSVVVLDDDEDRVFATAIGLEPGKHRVSVTVHVEGREGTFPPFDLSVRDERTRSSIEDVRGALGKAGIRIPSPERLRSLGHALGNIKGHSDAKATLSRVVSIHYARAREAIESRRSDCGLAALVLGPVGSGKTLLVRSVADHLGVPFASIDAANAVDPRGGDLTAEQILRVLLREAKGSVERCQYGIVCIENLQTLGQSLGEGMGALLLATLSRLIQGEPVEVRPNSSVRADKTSVIDSKGIFFVLEANLPRLEVRARDRRAREGADSRRSLMPRDLLELGMPAALADMFAAHSVVLDPPTLIALSELTRERWDTVSQQYAPHLPEGSTLRPLQTGLETLAGIAEERATGGHSIVPLIHEVFQFAAASLLTGETKNVDANYVESAIHRSAKRRLGEVTRKTIQNAEAVVQHLSDAPPARAASEAPHSADRKVSATWSDVVGVSDELSSSSG